MLADYQTLVTDLVRDDADRIASGQRDAAILAAVLAYSAARPRPRVADIADAAGMLLDLPAGWEEGFSVVTSIEHPVGRVPPALLAPDAWALYRDVDAVRIMLASSLPAGSTARVAFTAPHVVSATEDTVPAPHRAAVAMLAAAMLCDQLAAFYANDSDSTIAVDRAPGQSRSQAYAARARDYRRQYQDAVGAADRLAAPAAAVASLRPRDSAGNARLFHPPGGAR